MYYMLWINDIIIKNNNEKYDFLNELYPEIKSMYNEITVLQKSAVKKSFEQIDKMNEIRQNIKDKLEIYNIPEYILFKKENDEYMEPVSGFKFNIVTNNIFLREVEEEIVNNYINNLKTETVNFLNDTMPLFDKNIKKLTKKI